MPYCRKDLLAHAHRFAFVASLLILSGCQTTKRMAELGGSAAATGGAAAAATLAGGPLLGALVGALVHLLFKASDGLALQNELNSGRIEFRDPTKGMLFEAFWPYMVALGIVLLLTKREWVIGMILSPFKSMLRQKDESRDRTDQ